MQNNLDKHRYDYMLNMPHHQSAKRRHMTMVERAAQFGAFRALSGYEEAIAEVGRLTEERAEPDEYQKEEIDRKLRQILAEIEEKPQAKITYFIPDKQKEGGKYCTHNGKIKKIDLFKRQITFDDGQVVPIDEIFALECENQPEQNW